MNQKILTLKSRREFLALRNAEQFRSKFFIAQFAKVPNGQFEFGITASRKNGNAVRRNFIKRRLKEAIRQIYKDCPKQDVKVNFITRYGLADCEFDLLLKEIQKFFMSLK